MGITLVKVTREDLETVWRMQIAAFSELLNRYQDYDLSPGAEPVDKIVARYEMPGSVYYFIETEGEKVGVIRVVDRNDGSRKRISPLWIMAEYRGRGYAQAAITAVEEIYGSDNWSLDTILQEKGNCHLYEKMGYHRVGEIEHISDRMDIVFYEKN